MIKENEKKFVRKWQMKKLTMELIGISIALIGGVLTIANMFKACPVWAWIGIGIFSFGFALFMDVRNEYTFRKYLRNKKVR